MYRIIVNYALILFLLSNSKADNDSYILDYNFYIRNVFFQYHKANLSNLCMDAMVKLNFLQSTCEYIFTIVKILIKNKVNNAFYN